jgi:hypothetical protein
MKPNPSASARFLAALIALTSFHALADAVPTDGLIEELPHLMWFELGDTEFAPGDRITIQRVRGTSHKIAVGETYSVDGTYTLASREEADLAFYATTISNTAPTPVDARQHVQIKKGSGSFHLVKTLRDDGYPHVSFYGSGNAFGGVYFGQGDRVLRQKTDASPVSVSGPNRALLKYLGNPVEPPANLDARYTKEGVINAIVMAALNAGMNVYNIAIDDSEFPFLVRLQHEESAWTRLKEQLKKNPGYEYGGSVGSDSCHVFSIVPPTAYPPESRLRIEHRLTLREAVFYDKVRSGE